MRLGLIFAVLTGGMPALADTPRVITDIAPVHALVAQVLGDLGTPDVLLDPSVVDAHDFQLRPSQVRALGQADLVVWMGEELTPWMAGALDNVTSAQTLELLDIAALPMRIEGDVITTVGPDQIAAYDDKSKAPDIQTPSHGAVDPHAWLDPLNAVQFLSSIAENLGELDPHNAATYRANAALAQTALQTLTVQINDQLRDVRQFTLIPYHDAYRYFFTRFNLPVSGSIAQVDGVAPSAARLREVQDLALSSDQTCLFTEPGANEKLIRAVIPDQNSSIPTLNPINANVAIGPGFYETLIRNMAAAIMSCRTR